MIVSSSGMRDSVERGAWFCFRDVANISLECREGCVENDADAGKPKAAIGNSRKSRVANANIVRSIEILFPGISPDMEVGEGVLIVACKVLARGRSTKRL